MKNTTLTRTFSAVKAAHSARKATAAVALLLGLAINAHGETQPLEVYKDPQCGCCEGWMKHAQAQSLPLKLVPSADVFAKKEALGIPPAARSCHTVVDPQTGYIFEGHIPAKVIARFIAEKPDAKGLAVSGMPLGSPGMEMGDRFMPYDVLVLNHDGSTEIYTHIGSAQEQL
ncbi:DUF411 domain-containing protein [Pokkaliibacter sp. CJK22405]|uniref:DUF411 domain-containing protein n=1 Tax=Pokkaliibacter sp. CJK22405 TaxID=3384615 RepID=UPI003985624D